MKELLNAVYKRKSMRKYSGRLTEQELAQVKDYLQQLKPLCPEIKVEFEVVPCKDTNCKFNGEYCLIVYSQEGNLWLANIGYMLEQWDLYLATLNIGVCWYGMGKVDENEKNGLKYGIMLCFGKCGEEDFRKDVGEFNRKDTDDFWAIGDSDNDGLLFGKVGQIVRLAPSACNSQPWQVEQDGNSLRVYRVKGNTPVLSGILFKHWNKVDIGIFLTFLEVALESEGYTFTRELHSDTDSKKRVLTATYSLNVV
ncbi:MAG: nitroreductase [Clostridiales bacterium]|nr:nitroreductase [Clostridiales bacterium]